MKARTKFIAAIVASQFLAMSAPAADLTWTGCGITKLAFMKELGAAYEAKTGEKVVLSGGGATKGIRAAAAGTSAMGGTCRLWLRDVKGDVHPEEKNARLVQVAWDALVVVVHPSNPVDSISTADLKKIYNGEAKKWSELGGADKPIGVIARSGKTSGVGYMYRRLLFGDPNYTIKARTLQVKSTGPLEKKVEKTPIAVAIDGVSSARKRNLKLLSLDGVAPTKENIANGTYPLIRPLYIAVNKSNPSPDAERFVEFALSPEGQAIISQQGTVNLAEGQQLATAWESTKDRAGL